MLSASREEPRGQNWSPIGAQFGEEFGEVFEHSDSSLWLICPQPLLETWSWTERNAQQTHNPEYQ
jgi:hypothetical protein